MSRAVHWPWFGHRSLAEVDETQRLLLSKAARNGRPLPNKGDERLAALLWKARRANPPAERERGDAA